MPAEVILDQLTAQMYSFFIATATNYHNFSGLKQCTFIVTYVEIISLKGVHRAAFLLETIDLFQFLEAAHIL